MIATDVNGAPFDRLQLPPPGRPAQTAGLGMISPAG